MLTIAELQDEIMAWNKSTNWNAALDAFQNNMLYGSRSQSVELASGKVKKVAEFGGEGQGDTYYYVFSVGNQYFKRSGYYDSYDGTDWEDSEFFEVFPKEVTIIEYVTK